MIDRTVALPIGTRVVRNLPEPCSCHADLVAARRRRHREFGTVMPYGVEFSRGEFPVRWDSGFWEAQLDVAYVTAVSPEEEAALRTRSASRSPGARPAGDTPFAPTTPTGRAVRTPPLPAAGRSLPTFAQSSQ